MPLEIPSQGRKLPGHRARVGSGEHVVYHFFAKSVVRCTPDGEMLSGDNEMGCLFDDLAAAQRYCHWKVNEHPKIGCTVYDSKGRVADQIFNSDHLERVNRANAPKRQIILGSFLLICGCSLVWLDARHDWMLFVGFLIGTRLAVGGAAKLLLSLEELYEKRSARADRGVLDKLSR
jgi:hypothetical protein